MQIVVHWEDVGDALTRLVGHSYRDPSGGPGGTPRLRRELPWQHPYSNQLWVRNVSSVKGIILQGVNSTLGVGEGGVGAGAVANAGPWSEFQFALLTLHFWRPPYYVRTDSDVQDAGGIQQEWLRYTDRHWVIQTQMLSREGGQLTFVAGQGNVATGTATLTGSAVSGLTLVSGGTGYTGSVTVNIGPPDQSGGTPATATGTVSGGTVTSLTLTNAGTGYLKAPAVSITGAGGFGASATAATSGGTVTGVTITSPGSGYTGTPTAVFKPAQGGVAGTPTVSGGAVTGVTMTNNGSGYATPPAVSFTGGGAGGPATISGPPGSVGQKISHIKMTRRWFEVPEQALFQTLVDRTPSGLPYNMLFTQTPTTNPITGYVYPAGSPLPGCVNSPKGGGIDDTDPAKRFFGCYMGTLLYDTPELTPRPLQLPPEWMDIPAFGAGEPISQQQYDVTFHFDLFDPPVADYVAANKPGFAGHNLMPWAGDGMWYAVEFKGNVNGSGSAKPTTPFQYADSTDLFKIL
jgi:hypothetical protein